MGRAGWIEANGVALRYKLSGEGSSTLLLFHELGGTLDSWDYLVPLLEPHFRIARFDARGAGLSEKVVAEYGIEELSADANALLDALNIDGKITTVGTALGGANALHFAATYPRRTAASIATSPATGVTASGRQGVLDLASYLEANGPRAIVDRILDRGYPEALRDDRERFLRTRAQRCAPDSKSFAMAMRVLADLDLEATLRRINCPVLLLAGSLDPDRPPEVVQLVADMIPNASVNTVRSGHFMAIQTPDLLAAEIRAFLAALPSPA